jgi:endonuclease/exonuclease/phosphatase family metal-dependent hydrolase
METLINIPLDIATYNILDPYLACTWKNKEGYSTQTSVKPSTKESIKAGMPTKNKNNPKYNELKKLYEELVQQPIEVEGRIDNWIQRKEFVIKTIVESESAIICLQEVNRSTTYLDLKKGLKPKYKIIDAFDQQKTIGPTIAYDPTKVELIKNSVHIFKTGFEGRPQVCADFEDKATGRIIRICSVHLKGYDVTIYNPQQLYQTKGTDKEGNSLYNPKNNIHESWLNQKTKNSQKFNGWFELSNIYDVISKKSANRPIDQLIIAGDYNEDYETEINQPYSRHVLLQKKGFTFDGDITTPSEHKRVKNCLNPRKIDYIFVKDLNQSLAKIEPVSYPNHEKDFFDYEKLVKQMKKASDHALCMSRIHFVTDQSDDEMDFN